MRKRVLTVVAAVAAAAIAAAVVLLVGRGSDDGRAARPALDTARKPPVVVLILDEFPPDSLLGRDGRIDPLRFPNFAALASTSTWYRNASTFYDSTPKAIPEIMDGRKPFKGESADTRDHPHSIYTAFGRAGYRIVDSEEATAICPRRYCPHALAQRPGILRNLNRGRRERLEGWLHSIRPSRRRTFWLKHALLPHQPWVFLPSGRQDRPTIKDFVPGLASPRSFHDPALTDHNHRRYMLQLGFTDLELGKLLARMRETGIFDRALLVVTADHGMAFEVGVKDRRKVSQSNVDEIAPVPLFIKAPGQRSARSNYSYARTLDIAPTTARMAHVRLGYHADGHPVTSRKVRRRRVVRLPTRDFSRIVTIGSRALERRRHANVRHRLGLFGTGVESLLAYGDPWGGVYAAGPHRELVGRPLATVRLARAGKVRAALAAPGLTHSVRPSLPFVPSEVGGRIVRGRQGVKRDVAVSLNGRIVGVGRTFYIQGSPSENFDFILPETALRPGSNDVGVFEVVGRGRALRLVPLGTN